MIGSLPIRMEKHFSRGLVFHVPSTPLPQERKTPSSSSTEESFSGKVKPDSNDEISRHSRQLLQDSLSPMSTLHAIVMFTLRCACLPTGCLEVVPLSSGRLHHICTDSVSTLAARPGATTCGLSGHAQLQFPTWQDKGTASTRPDLPRYYPTPTSLSFKIAYR